MTRATIASSLSKPPHIASPKVCRAILTAKPVSPRLRSERRTASSQPDLSEELFEMSKKQGSVVTSAVMEMSRLVRAAASPAVPGEKVPHAIARAARRLGFDRGRVTSFWYGKARSVSPEELERARAEAIKRAHDAELLRDDYRRARDILARLEASLTVTDPDFFSPEIDAARDMASGAAGPGNPDTWRRGGR